MNQPVTYELKRSHRKTLSLKICQDGRIEVHTPFYLPEKNIQAWITEKTDWIYQKQEEILNAAKARASFTVLPGMTLLYLGREYPVRLQEGEKAGFDGDAFWIPGKGPESDKSALITLYRQMADQYIRSRVLWYAEQFDFHPQKIRIHTAETRWGSCSHQGNLNFSWKLIMAPPDAVDAVVVHELCHLHEFNHSALFWKEVYRICPNYSAQKKVLAHLHKRLTHENWRKEL